MRDIDEYKIKSPNERFTRIIDVLNKIFNAPEFDQYSILLQPQMHKVAGKVLAPPRLTTERGQASWDDYAFRKIKHADPVQLNEEKWTLIYSSDNYDRANKVIEFMQQASGSFGIKV